VKGWKVLKSWRKVEMPKLDLEKLAGEIIRVEYPTYEQAIPGLREAIIRKEQQIKQILERYIKQTAEAEGVKKKKVLEGCLVCIPYGGDEWLLLSDDLAKEYYELRKLYGKELTEEEMDKRDRRLWEIEREGQCIGEVLCDLEGKKVRITVEVVEEEKERGDKA